MGSQKTVERGFQSFPAGESVQELRVHLGPENTTSSRQKIRPPD